MTSRFLSTVFILLCIWGLSTPVYGQDDQDATLLPDIDPQDIEIRGEFKARFPGLTRQPILGFDPSLRIYQIDPERQPFMETGDEVVANLPVSSLSRPAPPEYSALTYNEEINAFARVGVGSYTSPEAQFWGVLPINRQSYLGGSLDFSSSDGHLDESSSFRFLDATAEYGTQINEQMELRIHGGAQNDFNYAADFDGTRSASVPRFEYEGFNGGIELTRMNNDIAGWKLQGNIRSFSTNVESQSFGGSIDEVAYNGSFVNRWALGNPNETIALKAGGRGGSYESDDQESQNWGTLQGGVAYERLLNYRTNIHAEVNAYYATDAREEKFYPGGLLQVEHWFGDRLKITGTAEGKPHLRTVEQFHEQNRFLGINNTLAHSYNFDVTGEASIKYYRGSKLHGGVKYSNIQDKAYFIPGSTPNPAGGEPFYNYNIQYQNATNFKLFAGITHQLWPEKFWVSGQFYLQNPELDNGEEVPFEENWGVNASMSFRPIDRITVEGWADYVGNRETGVSNNTVEEFFLVGAQLDLEITNNFGAYVKGVNLLDQQYQVWQGYQERPLQIYGGLTIKL